MDLSRVRREIRGQSLGETPSGDLLETLDITDQLYEELEYHEQHLKSGYGIQDDVLDTDLCEFYAKIIHTMAKSSVYGGKAILEELISEVSRESVNDFLKKIDTPPVEPDYSDLGDLDDHPF